MGAFVLAVPTSLFIFLLVTFLGVDGDVTVDALRSGKNLYGLGVEAADGALSAFDQHGYGYADYDGMDGYGISVATPARIEAMARLAGLSVTELPPLPTDLPDGWPYNVVTEIMSATAAGSAPPTEPDAG